MRIIRRKDENRIDRASRLLKEASIEWVVVQQQVTAVEKRLRDLRHDREKAQQRQARARHEYDRAVELIASDRYEKWNKARLRAEREARRKELQRKRGRAIRLREDRVSA